MTSSPLPTASDPMDESFLMSLFTPGDAGQINPVHEIVRRDVLEVRRTASGIIFFQCGCCTHLPRSERVKLSTFSPREVTTIYRSFNRFMMEHVFQCVHVPEHIRAMDAKSLRDNTVKGARAYWTKSARELGLENEGNNIVYKSA